jgi:AcrB/AcrD/AcrF family
MRTGTRAVAVCLVVSLDAGVAAAQNGVMTLAEVLARAREQAPQIVSARLALEETRGRLAGGALRPLAVVMIGGLVTSTLFTLLVLPTFYLQVTDGWSAEPCALKHEPDPFIHERAGGPIGMTPAPVLATSPGLQLGPA